MYAAAVGWLLPLPIARLYWLVGTFFIFPIAIVASKIARADPFSKGNSLGEAVGYTHMSLIAMTFPLVFIAFLRYPETMILVMAISYCLDFYLMTWAFGSRLFGIHAATRTVAVTIIWLMLPTSRAWLIPVVVTTAYGVTVVLSPMLRKKWLNAHSIDTSRGVASQ